MPDEVAFLCRCGHAGADLAASKPAWACVAGFDDRCLRWFGPYAPGGELPPATTDWVVPMDAPPAVGGAYALWVEFPFRAVLGEST